jgi:hypothetical protein
MDQALSLSLAAGGAGTLFSLPLLWRPVPSALKTWGLRVIRAGSFAAGVGLAAVALGASVDRGYAFLIKVADWLPAAGPALERLVRILPFHGTLGVAWAGIGIAGMARRRDPDRIILKTLALALGAVCLFLVFAPGIAAIYPWALRRYVVFLVPFLALAQSYAVLCWVEGLRAPGARWRWVALLLFLPALIQGARISAAAFRVGDYRGAGEILAALEQAADPRAVIVADDPLWGTPLLLAGEREVINGRLLWQSQNPDFQRRFMEALRRTCFDGGRRMLWLTSTPQGLGIYPVELGGNPAPSIEIPYAYHTVMHSRRANHFAEAPHERLFRLYEWNGAYSLRGESVLGFKTSREDEVK